MRRSECATRPALLFLRTNTSTTIGLRPAGDAGGHAQPDHLALQAGRSARAAVDPQMTYRRLRYSKGEAFRQATSGPVTHFRFREATLCARSTHPFGPRELLQWVRFRVFRLEPA